MSVEPSADPVAIAAWAWTSLQWARSQSGLPVVRPASDELMGRRGRPGILGDLLKQRDIAGAIDFISTAVTNSGVILAALQGLDKPPILDSGYLRHKLVVREVERLMQERTQTADVIYPGDEDMNVGSYL